jgi:sec-independent protein translocase protein TatA
MAGIGAPELLIVLAVVLLLFGSTKLPQLARSLGRAQDEFRKGVRGDDDEPKSGEPKPSRAE